MTNTIKNELIEELKAVKNKYNNCTNIKDFCLGNNIDCYIIITSDSNEYYINNFIKNFPEFDWDAIVYVCKNYYKAPNDTHTYWYWDTLNGFYDDISICSKNIRSFHTDEIYKD